jgi:hypothetical protein
MIDSYASGESNNVKEAFQSVDWKTVATYTVAGAVAGGVSSVAGGQAAALTDATWEFGKKVITGEKPKISYGLEFVENAHNAGFLDPEQMLWDFGTGAVLGGLGQGIINLTNSTGGVTYVTRAARTQNAALPSVVGAATRAVSEAARELASKFLDNRFKRMEEMLE